MKIQFTDKSGLLSKTAANKIKARLESSLLKFGYPVQRVVVGVGDVNGPRGGNDKECRISVVLSKLGEVVTSGTDSTLSKAVSKAIRRCERAIARRIERSTMIDREQLSEIGFEFYR
jgi:hypothetical protein